MSGECIIYQPLVIDESVIISGPPDAESQVYNAVASDITTVFSDDFSADIDGWDDQSSPGGSISWDAAGYMVVDNTTGAGRAFINVPVTIGKTYRVSFECESGSPEDADAYVGPPSDAGLKNETVAAGATESIIIYATEDTLRISVRNFSAGTETHVGSVGVVEIDAYVVGSEVWYGGHSFRSLQNENVGNTPVEGVWWTDLGQVDNGADAWTNGSYAKGTWKIRNHRLYESAVDDNTTEPGDTTSADTADDWTDYGPTNRYLAFDENLGRFSTSKGSLKWVLSFTDSVAHCVIFSPIGSSISLLKTSGTTELYNESHNLFIDGDVDYWGYFFVPPENRFNDSFDDMVSVPGEVITFEINSSDPASTVAASGIHFGLGIEVGTVVTGGTGLETKGFVSVDFDEFGNLISPKRPKQQITRFATRPLVRQTSVLHNKMNAFSQTACIAFMRDGQDFGLLAWGILDDHSFEMPDANVAELSVKIKGFPQ